MTNEEQRVWRGIERLDRRVSTRGEPLELDDATQTLLRAGARLVNIDAANTEAALGETSAATLLLREMGRRLREGSNRLGQLESRVETLRDNAEFSQARKALQDALSAEVVPHYREQIEIRLDYLATFESIFQTGRVEEDFHPWGQIRALALRLRQGLSLEMRDGLCDFLRRTAPTLAVSETELDGALKSLPGTESLVLAMAKRMEEGRQRISHALQQMIRLQEAGDLDGARGQLQAVLAVETIPQYRLMAEENLALLEAPPQKE